MLSYVLQAVSLSLCLCGLAVTATHAQATKNTRTVERVLHVAPLKAQGERYVYLPFDVPRGAARVHVAYEYPREGGVNTLDLGVFDSRGFRGWSGGRRAEFFITREEATPGYLAGELHAGRWRVVLGLYKVAPSGVDVKVKITVETESGRAASRTAPRRAPRDRGVNRRTNGTNLQRFAGDLHMHTVHSDGDWTVQGLVAAARATGLDFIFVTDHNTASHHAEVDEANDGLQPPLVMRGEEVTTYGGHANAWGLPKGAVLDFRVRPGDDAGMSRVAARAHQAGALISVNHPFASCGGCDWSYGDAVRDFDAVEVWNGEWDATDESALKLWDGLLRKGLRPTAVGSSDSHRAQNSIGHPTTHVAAHGLSQAALLNGIRHGRVYLTREATGPVIDFRAGETPRRWRRPRKLPGDEIRLRAPGLLHLFVAVKGAPPAAVVSLINDGLVDSYFPAGPDGAWRLFKVKCERSGYYRVEVRDREGKMLALTNPVYVKVRPRR